MRTQILRSYVCPAYGIYSPQVSVAITLRTNMNILSFPRVKFLTTLLQNRTPISNHQSQFICKLINHIAIAPAHLTSSPKGENPYHTAAQCFP